MMATDDIPETLSLTAAKVERNDFPLVPSWFSWRCICRWEVDGAGGG